MQFKILSALAVALAATQTQATFTPEGVANVFTELTDTASDIIQIAATLNPATIIASVPKLLLDFKDIGAAIIEAETGLDGLKRDDFSKKQENEVCDALENFIDKAKEAIDAIIGPDSIPGRTPFVNIIAQGLGVVEDGLESLARSTLDLVPLCEDKVEGKLDDLRQTTEEGFDRYGVDYTLRSTTGDLEQ